MLSVGGRRSVAHGLAVRRSVSAARRSYTTASSSSAWPAPRDISLDCAASRAARSKSSLVKARRHRTTNERDVVLRSVSAMEDGEPLLYLSGTAPARRQVTTTPPVGPVISTLCLRVDPVAARQAHHGSWRSYAAAGASAPVINGCSPRLIPRPRCTPEPRFVTWLRGTRIQKRIPAL